MISSIIYRNLFNCENPGQVNIIDFYIRRVRRIFPALIAVLITTLVLGWFVLLPDEYKLLGKHVFGGSVYINNFMLFNESGDYFNAASSAKPLLHLWSLGVEEQFYLIFPIFLYVIYKINLNFVLSLTLFTVASFCLNKYNINTHQQTSAFYLPWCRFWELSIGAILAYTVNYHKELVSSVKSVLINNRIADYAAKLIFRNSNDNLRRNLINNIISIAGLVIIIYGIISVKNDTIFPGIKALVPVFGALLIISAGKTAVINKYVLSNPIMVFLGLISYPLYLWHWPLLSLTYICEGQQPAIWIKICAVLIAVFLSVFTYFFIEPPLRYGKQGKVKAVVLLVILIIIGYIGLKIYYLQGISSRFDAQKQENNTEEITIEQNTTKYHNYFKIYDNYIDNCKLIFPHWNDSDPDTPCALQKREGFNNIALLGSSHAAHLFYGLSQLSKNYGNSLALFSIGSQSPFINLQTLYEGRMSWYKRIIDGYDYVHHHKNIKLILLADIMTDPIFIDLNNPTEKDYEKNLSAGVTRSLDLLKDRKVIIILDNPWLPFEPSVCAGNRPFTFSSKQCLFNQEVSPNYSHRVLHKQVIEQIANKYDNVNVIDISKLFCDKGKCVAVINSKVVYSDSHHLNINGSKIVANYIYKYILEKLN